LADAAAGKVKAQKFMVKDKCRYWPNNKTCTKHQHEQDPEQRVADGVDPVAGEDEPCDAGDRGRRNQNGAMA
jgi:hypothetical protein